MSLVGGFNPSEKSADPGQRKGERAREERCLEHNNNNNNYYYYYNY